MIEIDVVKIAGVLVCWFALSVLVAILHYALSPERDDEYGMSILAPTDPIPRVGIRLLLRSTHVGACGDFTSGTGVSPLDR